MEIFARGVRISSITSMIPFRKMLRTYRLLIEIDHLICDLVDAVSPATAAVVAIVKIRKSTAIKWNSISRVVESDLQGARPT